MNDQQFLSGVREAIGERQVQISWARSQCAQTPIWMGLRLASACLVGLISLIYPYSVAALGAL